MHKIIAAIALIVGIAFIVLSVPAYASLVGIPAGLGLDAVGFLMVVGSLAVLGLSK